MTEINSHKYSTGVLVLGTENIYEYIGKLLSLSELPLVSIGSGNGVIEYNIEKKFSIKIICVDPMPLSWSLSVNENRLPDYPTTLKLINKKKNSD